MGNNNIFNNLDLFHKAFIALEETRARPGLLSVSFHYDRNSVWRSSWVLEDSSKIHVLKEGSLDLVEVIYSTAEQIKTEIETKVCYCGK